LLLEEEDLFCSEEVALPVNLAEVISLIFSKENLTISSAERPPL